MQNSARWVLPVASTSRLRNRRSTSHGGVPSPCWRRSRRAVARRYGFREYDGPPLEPLELFTTKSGEEIVGVARRLREGLEGDVHEHLVEALYADAARIAGRAVSLPGREARATFDATLDRIVTSRVLGFPVMLALFALMFWLTISGANVPSALLGDLLVGQGHPWLQGLARAAGLPDWLRGLTIDGMYLATAWVVSVMLPPMAIFFPLFTLLEDFGYLPRVAFNLDRLFQRAGAHGRQAMSTMMGFGCNAAGVVATRIIDSPRERLIAILTNNFALCNGRWPTQILIATIFIGGLVPAHLAGLVSAAAVTAVALLGVGFTFATAWLLSRTVLKGQVSTFSLELPPYRPPRFWRTLYTSLIDRTLFVLWRAVVFALPSGALIWASVWLGSSNPSATTAPGRAWCNRSRHCCGSCRPPRAAPPRHRRPKRQRCC